jgi:hypothetical protein
MSDQEPRVPDRATRAIGKRALEDEHYERAISYPWERPPGPCLVTEAGVEELGDIEACRREERVGESGRQGNRLCSASRNEGASPLRCLRCSQRTSSRHVRCSSHRDRS